MYWLPRCSTNGKSTSCIMIDLYCEALVWLDTPSGFPISMARFMSVHALISTVMSSVDALSWATVLAWKDGAQRLDFRLCTHHINSHSRYKLSFLHCTHFVFLTFYQRTGSATEDTLKEILIPSREFWHRLRLSWAVRVFYIGFLNCLLCSFVERYLQTLICLLWQHTGLCTKIIYGD